MGMMYFGVWPDRAGVGHFLHDEHGRSRPAEEKFKQEVPLNQKVLDGGLLPRSAKPYQVYEVEAGNARLFSFWDRTGDTRPGSVSVFIAFGDGSSAYYMDQFRKVFPKVFARLDKAGVTLRLVEPDDKS